MKRTAMLLAALTVSGTCFAYENFGPYVGLGAGRSQASVDLDTGVNVFAIDADDTAWRVLAGYRFSPYVAVEATYSDYGDFSADAAGERLSVGQRGVTPWIVASWPLGRFELLARVGYFINTTEFELISGSDRIEVKSSQDSITFGAGVGAMLGRHINLRLEYERLDPDEFDDADALWLTVAWRFL
ncbi:MAG: porin family protein [Steroidobacteraceae bacterium]